MMLFLAEEKLSNLCSLLGAYSQYVGGSRSLHAHKLNRFNHVQLFVTQWTIPYQAPPSMGGRILEWVAMPFYRGSSQPRDQTQVSRISGEFFTI